MQNKNSKSRLHGAPFTQSLAAGFRFLLIGILSGIMLQCQNPASRSPLGTNLSPLDDWENEFPLLDVFKTSRAWISGSQTAWSDGRALDLDARGWVRSLQPGQIARTLMFWDLSRAPGGYPSGRYVVQYEGEGTIEYSENVTVVETTPGRQVVNVDSSPGRGGLGLYITATNPSNYLRNLRVRMPSEAPEGEIFNPIFLERISNYRVLRFTLMMVGADAQYDPRLWANRPQMEDARWNINGAPVEIMVALANRIGAEAWFSIPYRADDTYVFELAQTVRRLLNSNRRVYVEYSNEVWNPDYPVHAYSQQQGQALGLSQDPAEAGYRFQALRSRQIFQIFESVFPPERLVRVLSSWAPYPSISETLLTFGDTRAHTDALAIAPYFGGGIDDLRPFLRMSVDELMSWLETTALPQAYTAMQQQADVAARFGLPLIAYEAGQHLVARSDSGFGTDPVINGLFDRANRDPRMGTLYLQYLARWSIITRGGLFNHHLNCSYPGTGGYGRFGSLEYINQPRNQAPKYNALQTWISSRRGP